MPNSSQHTSAVRLPEPRLGRGKSLPESLRRRRTIREISDRKLPVQLLSNLVWAACGVNRRRGSFGYPGRTAASASDSQEIDLYVALEQGVYRFEAQRHRLIPVASGDLRTLAIGRGQQELMTKAPVQLIYVVDIRRLTHTPLPAHHIRFAPQPRRIVLPRRPVRRRDTHPRVRRLRGA